MQTKKFHISDILTITTGKILSTRGIDGMYDMLRFLMRRSVFIHQLPEAISLCQTHLFSLFPQFHPEDAEMKVALAALFKEMKKRSGNLKTAIGANASTLEYMKRGGRCWDTFHKEWISSMARRYGETFSVSRLPEYPQELEQAHQ